MDPAPPSLLSAAPPSSQDAVVRCQAALLARARLTEAPVALAHRELAGAASACSIPVVALGRVIGALALERDGEAFAPAELALCEDVASFAGPVLHLKQSTEMPWHRRLREQLRERLATPR